MANKRAAYKPCSAMVHDAYSFRGRPCSKSAVMEHDGKAYCNSHDPVKRKARQEARDKRWNAEFDASMKAHERQSQQAADLARAVELLGDALAFTRCVSCPDTMHCDCGRVRLDEEIEAFVSRSGR